MIKGIKRYVLIILLSTSLIPLIAFGAIFSTQTYSYLVNKDIEDIQFTLDREKKHIEDFVNVNINDMSLIALSTDISSQNQDEIIGIFSRFLNARKDYERIKYIYPDGRIIEVLKGEKGRSYKKSPLSVTERFCLENGNFATYSEDDNVEKGDYIIYSSPVIINNEKKGVIAGYVPVKNVSFLQIGKSKYSLGTIYIKDSRDRYITKGHNDGQNGKNSIELPINMTDWKLYAKIDKIGFAFSALKVIFANIVIFFILVIVAIVPIALYIAEFITKPVNELLYCSKTLSKVGAGSTAFHSIREAVDLRKNFNKMIDLINSNKSQFEDKAYIDKLTGLYNQRFVEERLKDSINGNESNRISFVMIKIVISNSTKAELDNGIWDMILVDAGNIIRESIRFMDIPIRLSMGEFLVVLNGVEAKRTEEIAENIVSAINSHKIGIKDAEIKINANIGISGYIGDIEKTIARCIKDLNIRIKNS